MLLIKDFKAKMVCTQTQKDNHLGQVLLRSFKAYVQIIGLWILFYKGQCLDEKLNHFERQRMSCAF